MIELLEQRIVVVEHGGRIGVALGCGDQILDFNVAVERYGRELLVEGIRFLSEDGLVEAYGDVAEICVALGNPYPTCFIGTLLVLLDVVVLEMPLVLVLACP